MKTLYFSSFSTQSLSFCRGFFALRARVFSALQAGSGGFFARSMRVGWFLKALIVFGCLVFLDLALQAQTLLAPKSGPGYITLEPQSMLILPLDYSGMSETAMRGYEKELLDSLQTIGIFTVMPVRSLEQVAKSGAPEKVCRDIVCGRTLAIDYEIDLLMQGSISLENGVFVFTVNLIRPQNAEVVVEQEFRSKQGSLPLFHELSNLLKANTPVIGKVLERDSTSAILSFGFNQGLKEKDQLVLFRQQRPDMSIYVDFFAAFRSTVAVVEIEQVTGNQARGRVVYASRQIEKEDRAVFYLQPSRQRSFVADAQKQIDREFRDSPPTKPYVSGIEKKEKEQPKPTIINRSIPRYSLEERENWIARVRYVEEQREFYRWLSAGGFGAVAGLYFIKNVPSPFYLVALGVGVYGFFQFYDARESLKVLIDEGRYRGFINYQWLSSRPLEPAPYVVASLGPTVRPQNTLVVPLASFAF